MRVLGLAALVVSSCVGIAEAPFGTTLSPEPSTDAGVSEDRDASVEPIDSGTEVDAGQPIDAGAAHDAGRVVDASTPDAGVTFDAGGVGPFDAGAFPERPGPFHGQVPTILSPPTPLMPTQGAFDDTCAITWNAHAQELLFTVCQVNDVWRLRPTVTTNAGFDIVRVGGEGVFGMQGLAVLPDGALVVAETVQHRLTISRGGYASPQPLVTSWPGDATTPAGPFNMPLHLVARSDGTIYFTDPKTESGQGAAAYTAVYRVAPNGTLSVHHKGLAARGLALSYDERTLFLSGENRYGEAQLYRVALAPDGAVGAATLLVGGPNEGIGAYGLCVDQADNLYHAARRGVRVYSPAGTLIQQLDVPGASDCSFGDADGKSVYFTTESSLAVHNLYRARVSIPGVF